MNLKISKH